MASTPDKPALTLSFSAECQKLLPHVLTDLAPEQMSLLTDRFHERYVSLLIIDEDNQITKESVVSVLKTFSADLGVKRNQYDVLELVLCYAEQKFGVTSPSLPRLIKLTRDKPAITPSGFIVASYAGQIIEILEQESESPKWTHDIDYIAGRAVVCLVLYEGVMSKKVIERLLNSDREGWKQIESYTYFQEDDVQIFPSPITSLWLNHYWISATPKRWKLSVNRSISTFFKEFGLADNIKSFYRMRQIARVVLTLHRSPVSQCIASGSLSFSPLPDHVIFRLITGIACRSLAGNEDVAPTMSKKGVQKWLGGRLLNGSHTDITIEQQIRQFNNVVNDRLSTITRGRKKPAITAIYQWIQQDSNLSHSPWLWLLVTWSFNLLKHGNVKRQLKPSTIRAYVGSLLKPFLVEFATTAPNRMTDAHWQDKLNKVIESIRTPKNKQYVHYFAKFLQGSGYFSARVLDGLQSESVSGRVDANLVVPKEVSIISEHLMNQAGETYEVARLILALGFYTGLRRGEVSGLTIRDFDLWRDTIVLSVRGNAVRDLKSTSSRRHLYLHILWPENEKQLIVNRIEKLKKMNEKRLFPDEDTLEDAFNLVTQLMSDITGDDSLRFHHLRHGFANVIWLALNRHNLGDLHDWIELCYQHYASEEFAQQLAKMVGVEHYSRKKLMMLSELMGHQHHATTVGSYLNIQPLLSSLALKQSVGESAFQVVYGVKREEAGSNRNFEAVKSLLLLPSPKVEKVTMSPLSVAKSPCYSSSLGLASTFKIIQRIGLGESSNKVAADIGVLEEVVLGIREEVKKLESKQPGKSRVKFVCLAMHKLSVNQSSLMQKLCEVFDRHAEEIEFTENARNASSLALSLTPSKDWLVRSNDIDAIRSFLRILLEMNISRNHFKLK